MGTITFYYLLIAVMAIWMAIKIGRESTGMGIATLVFWPIALIPLIVNWGQRGNDVRLQFLVACVATILLMNSSAEFVAQNQALLYDADDIEQIRAEDPAFAAEIEREQLRSLGVEIAPAAPGQRAAADGRPLATLGVEPVNGSRRDIGTSVPVAGAPAETGMQFAAAPVQIRKVPLRELNFRRGQVRLAPAFARLNIPEHFRFLAAHQLGLLAETRGIAVDKHTLGWIVHERVDLRSPRFWFVEVQFHEAGHLQPPTADAPAANGVRWDSEQALASYTRIPRDEAKGQDQATAKLLRHGALVFRAPELGGDQLELGLRAARLMAAQVVPDSGWAYRDFAGGESEQSLLQWIESQNASADSAAIAESEASEGASSSDAAPQTGQGRG